MKWLRVGSWIMAACITAVLVYTAYSSATKTGFASPSLASLSTDSYAIYLFAAVLIIPKIVLYLLSFYLGLRANNKFLKIVSIVLLLTYVLALTPWTYYLLLLQTISSLLLALGVLRIKETPSAHRLGIILLILGILAFILSILGIYLGLAWVLCAVSACGGPNLTLSSIPLYLLTISLFPILPMAVWAKLFSDASTTYETPRIIQPILP